MMQAPMNQQTPPGTMPPPPAAGAPGAAPGGDTGYPTGAEIMAGREGQAQQPQGPVENPVIAGFRSIISLIGELKQRGDPRAEQAAQHMQGLLTSLSGGDLPMQPPIPEGGAAAAGAPGAPGALAPGMPAPGGAPGMGGAPAGPPAPAGPEVMSSFDQGAPAPAPKPTQRPMMPQQQQKGKQPVVLS